MMINSQAEGNTSSNVNITTDNLNIHAGTQAFLRASSSDPPISRVSTSRFGVQANGASFRPAISADARYVSFYSYASNLVPGDTNRTSDIFRKDLITGAITRVSTSTFGFQANGASFNSAISSSGNFVAFDSYANNLVFGDTNGRSDIFRKNVATGAINRVSTSSVGGQANGDSFLPAISSDGRYVTFESNANNLVARDTNGNYDIFRKDLATGATTRVSTSSGGTQANNASLDPSISGNGRLVAFDSYATNLLPGDTNGARDIFLKDVTTGALSRVSTRSDGGQANGASLDPSISGNGRYVVFTSDASNLVPGDTNRSSDIFRKDLFTGAITRVSTRTGGGQANGSSFNAAVSSDGRYVAFESNASNLVLGDTNGTTDIFLKDMLTGVTTRLSASTTGVQGNSASHDPTVATGGSAAFDSFATNLVRGDTNGVSDIFFVRHA